MKKPTYRLHKTKRSTLHLPYNWSDRLGKIAEANQRTKVGQVKLWILREEKELPVIKM